MKVDIIGVSRALAALIVLVAATTVLVLAQPLILVAGVLGIALFATLRTIPGVALAFLVAGPLLGSRYIVAGLTLDNWISLMGVALVAWWILVQKGVPASRLSVFPLSLALAISISAVVNGLDSIPSVVRYVGIACIPLLIDDQRGLSLAKAERVVLGLIAVGASTVVLQSVLPFVPPYVDPDTGVVRFGGLFGHPNFAACVLCLALLYLFGRGVVHGVGVLLALLFAAAVMTTGSIGAVGALVVGLVLLVSRRLSTTIVAAVAGLGAVSLLGGPLLERVAFVSSTASQENSLGWRFDRWGESLALADPVNVTGIGWQQIEERLGGPAHSAFVAVYVELGILGCVLSLVGLAAMAAAVHWSRLGVAMILFVLVASLTDPIAFYPATLATWVAFSKLHALLRPGSASELVAARRS